MIPKKSERLLIEEIPKFPKERLTFLFGQGLELAGKNAEELGFSVETMQKQRRTWVLFQLKMTFSKNFFLSPLIEVETYPVGIERLFALRDFQWRVKDKILSEWRSKWLIMHMDNRRPLRPDDSLRDFASINEALPLQFAKHADTLNGMDVSVSKLVGESHIDLNKHLGSNWYLMWALELFYTQKSESIYITELDILFHHEAKEGDKLRIKMCDSESQNKAQIHIEKQERLVASVLLEYS